MISLICFDSGNLCIYLYRKIKFQEGNLCKTFIHMKASFYDSYIRVRIVNAVA